MQSDTPRQALVTAVIDIFVSTIGFIPRDKVNEHTRFLTDFNIIDDDLTVFVLEVQKAFPLNAPREEWQAIETIGQIADLIIRCREHPEDYPPQPPSRLKRTLASLKQKLSGT